MGDTKRSSQNLISFCNENTQTRNLRKLPQPDKRHLQKQNKTKALHSEPNTYGERLNDLSLTLVISQGYSFLLLLFNIVLEVPARAIR